MTPAFTPQRDSLSQTFRCVIGRPSSSKVATAPRIALQVSQTCRVDLILAIRLRDCSKKSRTRSSSKIGCHCDMPRSAATASWGGHRKTDIDLSRLVVLTISSGDTRRDRERRTLELTHGHSVMGLIRPACTRASTRSRSSRLYNHAIRTTMPRRIAIRPRVHP